MVAVIGLDKEIVWLFERLGEDICRLEDLRDFLKIAGETKKLWRVSRVDALGRVPSDSMSVEKGF